ncbi:MAG: hypothetical protein CM1200mP30_04760 [Pseudomonadota bacterium]|nr:MAG: hypothetical protein CM1200mP30_04760 [Pseudomonadota bacterium]
MKHLQITPKLLLRELIYGNKRGKVIIITGGAAGIGAGLAERFHQDGAKHIVVADLDEKKVKQVLYV